MLPVPWTPQDDACPVGDEFLGKLYRADNSGVSDLAETVAPDVRALLALYCYHRSHLRTRALVIAASCDHDNLVRSGGRMGSFIFEKSRGAPSPVLASTFVTRRTVTLATGPLRKMQALDIDPDDVSPAE